MRGHTKAIALVLTLAVLPSTGAEAQSYLPLEVGHTWELESSSGEVWRTRVAGTQDLLGRRVHRLRHWMPDGELWNYWSEDPSGAVLLHGFWRPDLQVGALYDPPLEWIHGHLARHVTWMTEAEVLDFQTHEPRGSIQLTATVERQQLLELPRGDFFVWPLSYAEADAQRRTLPGPALSPRGELRGVPDGTTLRQEYARGQGLVRETVCCPEEVRTLTSHLVSRASARWGALKSMYEGP